jgi:hypothetical protein
MSAIMFVFNLLKEFIKALKFSNFGSIFLQLIHES